jgi:hypothetical protein
VGPDQQGPRPRHPGAAGDLQLLAAPVRDLGIPVGTKGTLPRSARVRAGLEAEEVEDLGETGRRRPAGRDDSRSGGRPAGGSAGRSRAGGAKDTGAKDTGAEAEVAHDAPALPKRTGATRRRTRGGGAAAAAAATTDAAAADSSAAGPSDAASEGDGGAPRRRRRGGRGRRGADTGAPETAPAPE